MEEIDQFDGGSKRLEEKYEALINNEGKYFEEEKLLMYVFCMAYNQLQEELEIYNDQIFKVEVYENEVSHSLMMGFEGENSSEMKSEGDKSSSMGGFEESIGTRSTFEEDKVSMDTILQKTIQLTPIDESDQISSKQEEKSTILQGEFFPHMIHFNSFKNYDASHDRNSPCVDLSRKSNTFETLTPLTTPLHQTPSDEAIRKIRSEVTIIFTPLSTYANRVIQAPISIISNISKGVFRGGRKVAIHVSASFNFEGG